MKKINNKGFVLAETLVAATFVMVIFAIVYNNLYPLAAEYEKREDYDDVDSKYAVYWIKKLIQDGSYIIPDSTKNDLESGSLEYTKFSCSEATVPNAAARDRCNRTAKALDIYQYNDTSFRAYIVKYDTRVFKNYVKNNEAFFTSGLADYVNFLPEYSKVPSLNDAKYRVIVEFRHKMYKFEDSYVAAGADDDDYYYTYSTIEVKK